MVVAAAAAAAARQGAGQLWMQLGVQVVAFNAASLTGNSSSAADSKHLSNFICQLGIARAEE
jgi:hypothetical protein